MYNITTPMHGEKKADLSWRMEFCLKTVKSEDKRTVCTCCILAGDFVFHGGVG